MPTIRFGRSHTDSRPSRLGRRDKFLVCVLALALAFCAETARSFEVLEADTRLSGQVYLLDADIAYEFSEPALTALHNGVPLTVSLEMEVLREREWIWDETVASLEQRLRLEHHALTRQYVVTNLNSGVTTTFPTLAAATAFLGELRDFPLLDAAVLEGEGKYFVRLRVSLEIESLPAPLRPVAYLSGDWRLISEWYQWPL